MHRGELPGEGSVAVAIVIGDRRQLKPDICLSTFVVAWGAFQTIFVLNLISHKKIYIEKTCLNLVHF